MNVPPVSVERVQKCVVNFEIHRFLKKAANLPHPPLQERVRDCALCTHSVFWPLLWSHCGCRRRYLVLID